MIEEIKNISSLIMGVFAVIQAVVLALMFYLKSKFPSRDETVALANRIKQVEDRQRDLIALENLMRESAAATINQTAALADIKSDLKAGEQKFKHIDETTTALRHSVTRIENFLMNPRAS